jgi:hypothetical protein
MPIAITQAQFKNTKMALSILTVVALIEIFPHHIFAACALFALACMVIGYLTKIKYLFYPVTALASAANILILSWGLMLAIWRLAGYQ